MRSVFEDVSFSKGLSLAAAVPSHHFGATWLHPAAVTHSRNLTSQVISEWPNGIICLVRKGSTWNVLMERQQIFGSDVFRWVQHHSALCEADVKAEKGPSKLDRKPRAAPVQDAAKWSPRRERNGSKPASILQMTLHHFFGAGPK